MAFNWRDCRILVTGARGFLGSNLALRLVELGSIVYGTARGTVETDSAIRWLRADLLDRTMVRSAIHMARPDVIFHLAGQTNAAFDRDLVVPTMQNNLVSTVLVLLEALESDVSRVVVTGSLEEPSERDLGVSVLSPYGVSKWASVIYSQMFCNSYELPVSILRLYMTYGPKQNPTKLIPYVALELLRGLSPTVSQPDRTVDWVYVDDIVAGLLAAGNSSYAPGRVIDLGSGKLTAIRDLIREIELIVGAEGRTKFSVASRAVGVSGRSAIVEDAAQYLGWRAQTPLRTGLERTVAWYREQFTVSGKLQTTERAGRRR